MRASSTGSTSSPFRADRHEFRILGELQVRDGAGPIRFTAHKPRSMLAVLLLRTGQLVSWCRLTEELWPGEPPPSATANLRTYAAQIRRGALGSAQLSSDPAGYCLRLGDDVLDLQEFERLCGAAGRSQRQGDLQLARDGYEHALRTCHGTPLSGLRHGPALAAAATALEERRAGVVESLFDVRLDLGEATTGSGPQLAEQLRHHIGDHPLRERPRRQLVVALYRMEDVAGALEACAAARESCREMLGLDPGDGLERLRAAVLARDPALLRPGAQDPSDLSGIVVRSQPVARERPRPPVVPPRRGRPLQVAVCGPATCTSGERAMAEAVGRLLAERGAVVLSTGEPGVPSAAADGALAVGGTVIGVAAASRTPSHPVSAMISIGKGETPTAALIRSADVVITVGGSWATMSAVSVAVRSREIRVVALAGWQILDAAGCPVPGVTLATRPRHAVDQALDLARSAGRWDDTVAAPRATAADLTGTAGPGHPAL